jgi:universal stress protein E
MAEKDTVLAILEFDCFPDLLIERTAWLAHSFDLDVHLVLSEPNSGALLGGFSVSSEADNIRRDMERIQVELVEQFAEKLREKSLTVSTSVLRERPLADGVLQLASELAPKIVVKSTRYHNQAERSIMVDSDWQLMRVCPYPLWFVKADSMPEHPMIVAAVDPSNAHDKPAALDHEIVRTAKAIAQAADGDAHLLHVYERLVGIGSAASKALNPIRLPIDEIDTRIKNSHRDALNSLAEANEVQADHVHQLPGKTEEILPMFTRTKGAALVVMGALARWGLKRMIIGSTAERTIDHLNCDVLIVRLGDRQLYEDWHD